MLDIWRWYDVGSTYIPDVGPTLFGISKATLRAEFLFGIKYYAVLGRKISSSANATNVDYNVYFQQNTVLVDLFMFTVINFHISMTVEFFCDYKFWRFSFFCYLSHGTKIRLHNRLGYTAAQSTKYLRLVLNG